MSLREHNEGGRPVDAVRVADVVRVEPTLADVEVHIRSAVELPVGARRPLAAGAVREERTLHEALGVAHHQGEVREVVGGHVALEGLHVTDRRANGVAREHGARLEGQDEHVPGRLRVELGEVLRGRLEQALVLRPDIAVSRVREVRVDLLEHAEDVLDGDVQRLPVLLGRADALEHRLELREDDKSAVGVRVEDELALALGRGAVAAFGRFARDVRVVALSDRFDVIPVELTEVRHEGVTALDGRLGRPVLVPPVRALAALACPPAGVTGVHDLDPVGILGGPLLRDLLGEPAVHHHAQARGVVTTAEQVPVVARPLAGVGTRGVRGSEQISRHLLERNRFGHDGLTSDRRR